MNLDRSRRVSLLGAAFLVYGSAAAVAEPYTSWNDFSITTTVDENGNGLVTNTDGAVVPLRFALQTDPGPGGLTNVLTYSLAGPPGLTAGDVLLQEGVGGLILDVVRFNPTETCVDGTTGCLAFYSDNVDGVDSLADTPSPPGSFQTNTVTIVEVGPEGNNGATYTPVTGQPGFVAGAAGPVTYNLISDGSAVPEPASLAILGFGLAGLGLARIGRRRKLR